MAWDIKELKVHLDKNQLLEVNDVLDSIGDSLDIFRYHLITAKNALNFTIPENDPHQVEQIKLALSCSDNQEKFNTSKIIAKANSISALYTVRSMYDYFSELTRVLFIREKIHNCDIYKVMKKLQNCELKDYLARLLATDEFKYITAFINTVKHRNLIKYTYEVRFDENKAGIQFLSFSYNKIVHPQKESIEFLQCLADVQNSIIKAGNILNEMHMK